MTNTTLQLGQIPSYYYKAEQRDKSKQNMGVNEGRWEHSLVKRYFVKRSSKFTITGIFLFAPCPLSLTQVVVRDVLTSYEAICLNTNRRQLSPPPNVYCP